MTPPRERGIDGDMRKITERALMLNERTGIDAPPLPYRDHGPNMGVMPDKRSST